MSGLNRGRWRGTMCGRRAVARRSGWAGRRPRGTCPVSISVHAVSTVGECNQVWSWRACAQCSLAQ